MVHSSALWLTRPLCRRCDHCAKVGNFISALLGILTPALTLAALVRQVAREILQIDQVPPLMKDMGSEDFSFYAQHIPGVYFRLGTRFPDQPPRAGHNPHFDIDEAALPIGVAVLAEVVCRYLAQLKTDTGR